MLCVNAHKGILGILGETVLKRIQLPAMFKYRIILLSSFLNSSYTVIFHIYYKSCSNVVSLSLPSGLVRLRTQPWFILVKKGDHSFMFFFDSFT